MKFLKTIGYLSSIIALSLSGCGGGGVSGNEVSKRSVGTAQASQLAVLEEQLIAQKVVFVRTIEDGLTKDRAKVTYKWGEQTVPAHSTVGKTQDFVYSVGRVQKPTGEEKIQYASFTFESKDIFTTNPDFHFAVILKHEGTGRWNRGRGFIVGNLDYAFNGEKSGCGPGVTSTPETWFIKEEKAANTVFTGSHCGSRLNDNQKYKVEMYSGNENSWTYQIKDINGVIVGGSTVIDNYATNPEKDLINNETAGFAIGVVFANNHNSPFELIFDNIEVNWK